METALLIGLFLVGLVLTLKGADWLVEGASSVARRVGFSEFIIGMAIVGIGTSMPELVVSLNGAFAGNSDVAVGNIIGSNVFNTFVILGVTALILPLVITRTNRKFDLPFLLGVLVLFITLGNIGDGLSRLDGAILLAAFIAYLFFTFKSSSSEGDSDDDENTKQRSLGVSLLLVVIGIACLILGGQWFVNSATGIARILGVSDKFIAITILAGGTSLPELVTCVVAATKGKGQLALGNIVGSNISNILLILGCSSLVHPISFGGLSIVDLIAVTVGAVILSICAYTFDKDKLDRYEGVILLACEVAYFTYLVMSF